MFDTYNKTERITEHVPYEKTVTINEHKAPTDDSIRIFNEVKEKALKDVLKYITSKDNSISLKGCLSQEPMSLELHFNGLLLLNGKEVHVSTTIKDDIRLSGADKLVDIRTQIVKAISEVLAKNIFIEAINRDKLNCDILK